MHYCVKSLAAVVVTLGASLPVLAQHQKDTVTLPAPVSDTAFSKVQWSNVPVRHSFPINSFIVPAGMIAYGFTSLATHGLKQVNVKLNEELALEHPHQRVSIDNYLQYAPAVAVYGLNAMGIHGKHNFKDRTILYTMSMLISNTTIFSLKKIAGEQRPDASDHYSFPSGHTANAFVAAEFMRQEYKDVSPWYGVAGYAMAATTGYLRMYNNKHWFSDVVAGAGIGIASTKLSYWLYPILQRNVFKSKQSNTVVMPTYQDGAIGLGLVRRF